MLRCGMKKVLIKLHEIGLSFLQGVMVPSNKVIDILELCKLLAFERERAAKPKRDRERDRKRKDDDPILDPAPEKVKGFGSDIPAFLKR